MTSWNASSYSKFNAISPAKEVFWVFYQNRIRFSAYEFPIAIFFDLPIKTYNLALFYIIYRIWQFNFSILKIKIPN